MTLVVDASVAFWACGSARLDELAATGDLVAPRLMWSETLSVLHANMRRGTLTRAHAEEACGHLARLPVARRDPARLPGVAWAIAEELGWARTYDAEYLALARLVGARVVTLDGRLLRGAERTGLVVALHEALPAS